ncbi:MAG: hypothetical protein IKB08_03580 [Clostridia bacterium]|nr:hypothetical protein [Clostridia bacterium]
MGKNNIFVQILSKKARDASLSCQNFLHFVNEIESFPQYYNEIFTSEDSVRKFYKIWQEMEEINACALSEWEDTSYFSDFSSIWQSKYKKSVETVINKLLSFIESVV